MFYEGGLGIDGIRAYLITVISAACICTIVIKFTEKQGTAASLVKILAGIFLSISVLSPILKISFSPIDEYLDGIQIDAEVISENGIVDAQAEKETIIKDCLSAYILEKANSLGISIRVELELGENMVPSGIKLIGNASPYVRRKLESYITDTLGIPKEDQRWM